MAISGLVIFLRNDPIAAEASLAALGRDARLTLGERFGTRVAAVAETPSVEADRTLWDDLHALPGVEYVDVTFVGLDAPEDCNAHHEPVAPTEGDMR